MRQTVSVIIPCFRQARYLRESIESVLNQTEPCFEIIVVNDGSDDDVESSICAYRDRIRYVSQPHKGVSLARNAGLKAASGEWVFFLDADDWIAPQSLELLLRGASADSVSVMGYSELNRYGGELLASHMPPAQEFFPYLIDLCFGPPHCFLTPRALVEKVGGFDSGLVVCEDWDLWIRLALSGVKVRVVDFVGAFYRRHPGTASTNWRQMLEYRTRVLLKLHHSVRDSPNWTHRGNLLRAKLRVARRLQAHFPQTQIQTELRNAICEEGVLPGLQNRIGEMRPLNGSEEWW